MESGRYPNPERTGHYSHPKASSASSQTTPSSYLNTEEPSQPHNINIKIPSNADARQSSYSKKIPTPIRKEIEIISSKRNQPNGQTDLRDVLWEQINLILKEHDFPQMKLVQSENKLVPDYSSLTETVLNLLNHISLNEKSSETKIEEMKNVLETSQETLNKLNEKYQELKLKLKKRNQKIDDLRQKLTKFSDLDNILKAIHSNTKNKSKEIFKHITHREYDPDLEADMQVMSVILLYEHSKISTPIAHQKSSTEEEEEKSQDSSTENSILPLILNKLEVKSSSQALEVIDKMQQVILIIPNIESFISSIYKVLYSPEPAADISVNMEQILPTIIKMKVKLIALERFRKSICENFELDVNNADEVIVRYN